jgi:hypothetical protein
VPLTDDLNVYRTAVLSDRSHVGLAVTVDALAFTVFYAAGGRRDLCYT